MDTQKTELIAWREGFEGAYRCRRSRSHPEDEAAYNAGCLAGEALRFKHRGNVEQELTTEGLRRRHHRNARCLPRPALEAFRSETASSNLSMTNQSARPLKLVAPFDPKEWALGFRHAYMCMPGRSPQRASVSYVAGRIGGQSMRRKHHFEYEHALMDTDRTAAQH